MRIISGQFKGRSLKAPDSKFTRPTTDRVRETLFNLLNNRISFEGIRVLDIYSGSGALGLEAASRGAGEVHFIEKNFPIYKILEENIKSVKGDFPFKIFKMEAVRFSTITDHARYDLILADPPFFKDDIHTVVKNLLRNGFLAEEGLIIIERSIQTKDNDIKNFGTEPFKRIGDTLLYSFENSASE
ncbi:MAG: 16S rRNA (guanine(966)-N(2))-methyltransferase RsmD [Ignavibacteria bacterium]|jgi:16S rRNA (guanine966-N2)-methyltransferase|nr:16S rRNA (guanine(966)-N(2))-methyltransferase RsmD [Ignavibacteria bacterium]MCU7504096.1 16S rRNA (guanine(966)-N(2))-methyltransferase RsmD [Ignavibacteria bacterium]MCU7516454.1 16S rRNA (guanine(966)-N(2))-methyltransferase RsmD [Ignavibacteria bacterium]